MSTILDYMEKSSPGTKPIGKATGSSCNANVLKPQLDSSNIRKQIMHNMESVMKSLKKKHKHRKHRKKATKAVELITTTAATNVETSSRSEDEEEPLSNLKSNWLSARRKAPVEEAAEKSMPGANPPDKKNAFTLLMNGNGKAASSPESLANNENDTQLVSPPPMGKRKPLIAAENDQVKRRKIKSADASPKSPGKKRRKKQKLFECYVETIEPKKPLPEHVQTIEVVSDAEILTPSCRPRRSCASNVSYAETSPTSSKNSISTVKPNSQLDARPPITINLLQDSPMSPKKKLAPLFVKSLPKPAAVDPKVLEARQSFLKSNLPEKMRLEMEKKKVAQEEASNRQLSLFPTFSHVPPPPKDVYLAIYDEDELFPRNDQSRSPVCSSRTYSLPVTPSRRKETHKDLRAAPLNVLQSEAQKKQLVRSLKTEFEDSFPVHLLFKSLSKKQKTSDGDIVLFTEKFKPASSSEFLFNLREVAEVKEYLESFVLPSNEETGSSYETDDEDSIDAFGNGVAGVGRPTLVLHGPSSTGKTSAVYAIASELNCNVIEINASARRNGAQLLHRVMEATQSHKVPTAKMSLNRKILRRMERAEKRMSIILIEDVDVIFPEDTGFLAAITQLMSLTKRPIILTTNNRNAPSLKKTFEGSANFKFLEFQRAAPEEIETCVGFLQLLGIVNGCSIDRGFLRHVYEACRGDLRQTMSRLNVIAMTREIDLNWPTVEEERSESVAALPCCNLQSRASGELCSKDLLSDLAWTLDNLCAADRWCRGRGEEELIAPVTEMFSLGSSLLAKHFDLIEEGYPEADRDPANQIFNYTNRHTMKLARFADWTDVEPILRNVCRSELHRKDRKQRQKAKFNHYLLREAEELPVAFGMQRLEREEVEFLNETCSVFKDEEGEE